LGLGRGPVDFVRQHDVREQRPGLEHEGPAAVHLLQDRVAGDVTRQQVGGELHPLGPQAQALREALDQFGLAEARQALQQDVAARQHAGEHQINKFFLSEEHLIERGGKRANVLSGGADFGFGGVFHEQSGVDR
jgi:hypothetical protein